MINKRRSSSYAVGVDSREKKMKAIIPGLNPGGKSADMSTEDFTKSSWTRSPTGFSVLLGFGLLASANIIKVLFL